MYKKGKSMAQENTSYKSILKDSYKNPSVIVSHEQRYNLANALLRIGLVQSDNIIKIASMLTRYPEDSYYITYGLLMQYNRNMEDFDNNNNKLSQEKKSDALEEACQIIAMNIDNKEFINQVYLDIRLGTNIEKIYYPKQLRKELIQIKNFNVMINKLKTSERF